MKVARVDGESGRKRRRIREGERERERLRLVDAGECLDDAGDCEMMVYSYIHHRLDRRVSTWILLCHASYSQLGQETRHPPAAPLNDSPNSLPYYNTSGNDQSLAVHTSSQLLNFIWS